MADDVFSQTGIEVTALSELVGEGKKFATIEDLAKGKQEADSFIDRLEGEAKLVKEQMVELEKKAQKEHTVSELIAAVKATNEQDPAKGNQPISTEDLSGMVKSIMDGEHVEQTKSTNRAQANKAVLDKLNGDVEAARSYVAERAKALGTTVDKLQALGEDSPSAFQKLMELDPSTGGPQSVTALPGTQSPSDTVTTIEGHNTKAYYDALKKEMGAGAYWRDVKLQGKYHEDAMFLEDRFNQ